MIDILEILDKIEEFSGLEEGWNFGVGRSSSPLAKHQTHMALMAAIGLDLDDAEVFPGVDGEIQLNFYKGKHSLEMIFEIDGTVSITLDDNDVSVCLARGATQGKVVKLLQDFAYDQCHSYVSSTSSTTTAPNINASLALRFDRPATAAVFRFSKKAAAVQEVKVRAYTLKNTMRQPQERLSSFGKSRTNVSRTGVRSAIA